MKPFSSPSARTRGFTLPAVLVICAAMLILAVGLLALIGVERKTARSFSDSKRAELAARAGLDDFRALLTKETANDDFLVIADLPNQSRTQNRLPLPNLYLARGEGGENNVTYRYLPLFTTKGLPSKGVLKAPPAEDLLGDDPKEFGAVSGFDAARVAWITINDSKGEPASRYAYWVEDLQGKVDPKTAGNLAAADGSPQRAAYPFPAAGINPEPLDENDPEKQPRLNQVAINVLDPDNAADVPGGDLTKRLIANRPVMLSPESVMAAANIPAPLLRDQKTGLFANTLADSLDRNASAVIHSYKERPTVPFAAGISDKVAGQPKKNLNKLLSENRDTAVNDFAEWVNKGLPKFVDRKGGFPDDYLRTLAANTFDYADEDSEPTVKEGVYRGLDSYPLLSEIVLQVNYQGTVIENGQRYLKFNNRLFVELWNMTDKRATGKARCSYEVDLHFSTGIGAQPASRTSFDDPTNLAKAQSNLTQEDGKFWSPDIAVDLQPDQYRFYEVANVTYKIAGGDATDPIGKIFTLTESEGGVDNAHKQGRGVALKWNSQLVDSNPKIKHIDTVYADSGVQFQFNIDQQKTVGKGSVPGQSYRGNGVFSNNMGDPRAAMYLRDVPLDENAYPENLSPNRRNIRIKTIYSVDGATKPLFYGRAQPSEWPDGGHDSSAGTWPVQTDPKVIPTDTKLYPIPSVPADSYKTAPQRISNRGRFYSATELGRVYDPLMWTQVYDNSSDNATFNPPGSGKPQVPSSQHWLPEVLLKSSITSNFGGGSTLRIGRPEHPRFDLPGQRAANLLDLFHAGESTSEKEEEREGDVITVAGAVNLNTANRDAIRALAAGILGQDPALGRVTSWSHQTTSKLAPPVTELKAGTPTREGDKPQAADRVADAIIKCRPFASAGELTAVSETPRSPAAGNKTDTGAVFGNRKMYIFGDNLQWNDAAAEEVFARVYEASTFRSRNFRIWVIGQALAPSKTGGTEPEVLAEVHKVYTVFADPGERKADGSIDPKNYHPRVIHENDF